mgnify:CR=1 FL=1
MAGKLLAGVGVAALVLFGASGLIALGVVRDRITLVAQDSGQSSAREAEPVQLLAADVAALRADLVALSEALGPQLEQLHSALEDSADERAQSQQAGIEKLAGALASTNTRVDALAAAIADQGTQVNAAFEQLRVALESRAEADLAAVSAPIAAVTALVEPEVQPQAPAQPVLDDVAAVEPAPAETAETPPPAQRKFLSFKLPSKSFSFSGRQRLAILPSLSRVGFDAKSTLHDFSGVTQKVEGELEVDLAQPTLEPSGSVVVDARSLDTGMADRDEGMREHLDVQRHAQLRFTWTGLRDAEVDLANQRVRAVAVGRLSIKGVEREVALPVQVSVDSSQRVGIEGELKVRMRDFGVEPPSQLGMIRVENEIRLWLSLRARSLGAVKAEASDAK